MKSSIIAGLVGAALVLGASASFAQTAGGGGAPSQGSSQSNTTGQGSSGGSGQLPPQDGTPAR
jgi:hypothetical protein